MTIITNFVMLALCCTIIPVIIFIIYFAAKIINLGTRYIINGVETLYYELQKKSDQVN
jgi:TM2 domain-containing membrane protein YozV